MTGTLILFARPDVPEVERWAHADMGSNRLLGSGAGMPAPEAGIVTVLVLHGTSVSNTSLALPKRITTQVRQALPMLLEDTLATSAEDIHAATGARVGDTVQIAVTSPAYMTALMAEVRAAGHEVALAAPDYMLLAPDAPNTALLYDRNGFLIVGLSGAKGGTFEKDIAARALPGLLADVQSAEIHDDGKLAALLPAGISAIQHTALPDEDFATLIAAAAQVYRGPNLLQGPFSKRRAMRLAWPNWRRTTALAAILMTLVAGHFIVQGISMNRQAEALDAAKQAKMQATFPGVRNLSHFRAKIRQLEARGEDPFLRLSAALFRAVSASDGASLTEMRYDEIRREMVATLIARSLADAEVIGNTIAGGSDIRVSQREARPASGGQVVTLMLEIAS